MSFSRKFKRKNLLAFRRARDRQRRVEVMKARQANADKATKQAQAKEQSAR